MKSFQNQEFDLQKEIQHLIVCTKEVLTFEEVVKYTGFASSYLYKLTSARKIPHYKPEGKLIFFKRDELISWLLRNPSKTKDQIQCEADNLLIK